MRKILTYTLPVLTAVIFFISCKRENKVIPRGKMAEIYAEMFVIDQLISQDNYSRKVADTTLVYEPILEKYGYTAADFRASVDHYIKDPDRYARILRNTGVILESQLKELKKEKALIESLNKLKDEISDYIPEKIYALTGLDNPDLCTHDSLVFYLDSTGGDFFFDTRKWLDTAFYGPVISIKKPIAVAADTSRTGIGDVAADGDATLDADGTPRMHPEIIDDKTSMQRVKVSHAPRYREYQ